MAIQCDRQRTITPPRLAVETPKEHFELNVVHIARTVLMVDGR